MALMQHRFEIENADGTEDIHTSTLCAYGEPQGTTAMAATVGVTAAVGLELLLSGNVKTSGVLRPVTPEIYLPGLELLEKEGFKFKEVTKPKVV
jgi:saccharopine dehydrogenase-like NADP-dependent oxidoreductase